MAMQLPEKLGGALHDLLNFPARNRLFVFPAVSIHARPNRVCRRFRTGQTPFEHHVCHGCRPAVTYRVMLVCGVISERSGADALVRRAGSARSIADDQFRLTIEDDEQLLFVMNMGRMRTMARA